MCPNLENSCRDDQRSKKEPNRLAFDRDRGLQSRKTPENPGISWTQAAVETALAGGVAGFDDLRRPDAFRAHNGRTRRDARVATRTASCSKCGASGHVAADCPHISYGR